jgi:hypothetical protein
LDLDTLAVEFVVVDGHGLSDAGALFVGHPVEGVLDG